MKRRRKWLSLILAGVMALTGMAPMNASAADLENLAGETAEMRESLVNDNPTTYCNPINISYPLQSGTTGDGANAQRTLADAQPIFYNGEYWLFPSFATGYYHSKDLVNWEFVYSNASEINNWAPGVFEHDGYLYIGRTNGGHLWRTKTPEDGASWQSVRGHSGQDPYYFKDPDTGRIFLLEGLSGISTPKAPIRIRELDTTSPTLELLPIDYSRENATANGYEPFKMQRGQHGYEMPGQFNDNYDSNKNSWLEGAGMIKHNGKYYVYYSGPATECAAYADGCYVSDDPLGPYEWCSSSPFDYKVSGYTVGSAHGHDVVEQGTGQIWKFGSVSVTGNGGWERRLSLYPLFFDQYERPVTDMSVSDYPMWLPQSGKASLESQGPGWELLSYNMQMTASSTLDKTVKPSNGFDFKIDTACAADENIRTWWSANTGNAGEWLQGDMGEACTVNALQLNFMDEGAYTNINNFPDLNAQGLADARGYTGCYKYKIEYSLDGENWSVLVDKSDYSVEPYAGKDYTHDYYELKAGTQMRYVRVTNMGNVPAGAKFAISGLRIFGKGNGAAPAELKDFTLSRPEGADERSVTVSWDPVEGAEGYVIHYGTYEDSRNLSHQVVNGTSARINCLTTYEDYYFSIDTYNDSGRTAGATVKKLDGRYAGAAYENDGKLSAVTGVGLQPELPKTVQAAVGGTEETLEVVWDAIPAEQLSKAGTITVGGTVKWGGRRLEATVEVCEIIGIEAVSLACAVNQAPELPDKVTVYYSNGSQEQRQAVWEEVPSAQLAEAGMVAVTGKVGENPIQASLRVVAADSDALGTPAGKNLALNADGKKDSRAWPRTFAYYSNANEEAHNATDGVKDFVSGANKHIWSDYQAGVYHTNANAGVNADGRLPFVATAFGKEGTRGDGDQLKYTVQAVSVGFAEEDGDSAHKICLPEDYKIEYYSANNGVLPANRLGNDSASGCSNTKGWKEDNPIKAYDGWTEVSYIGGKPAIPASGEAKKMIDIQFEPVETTVIRITLTPKAENWVGLEEFEAYYVKIQEHADYEITAIQVDGKDVLAEFGASKELTLDQEAGTVTAKATNNASVTVLKPVNRQAKVLFLPENGDPAKAQEYTLNFKEKAPEPKEISACQITLAKNSFSYNGKPQAPAVAVKDGATALKPGTDYTLSYENNTNASSAATGKARAVITGKGNYTGTAAREFTITKAAQSLTGKTSYDKAYGSKAFSLGIKRKSGNGKLSYKSSNEKVIKVSSKGNVTLKNTGIATITVTAAETANYKKASRKVTVKVSPAKQKLISVKASKGQKLSIQWKKDPKASGYEIQYATDKNFKKGVKAISIKKGSTVRKATPKLKKGRRYYIRVRAYKTAKSGKKTLKLNGAWSSKAKKAIK